MPNKHAGRQRTIRLNETEDAMLASLAIRHGSIKGAIVAGLKLLAGANDIDLPTALERAAAELRILRTDAEASRKAHAKFGKKG